jgi:hypothetical protein
MGSSRRAHHMLGSGLPSVGDKVPLLPSLSPSVNPLQSKGEGATSMDEGLPPQKGATSPRGAHLPRPTNSI